MLEYKKRVWVEIDLSALSRNIESIRKIQRDARIIAVVKADGYGHGAVEVARHLREIGIDFFAVSSLREAMELRLGGIEESILILGFTSPEEAALLSDNNISQAVYSLEYGKALIENLKGKSLKIHIKLNTGMNRLGFNSEEAPTEEIIELLENDCLNFEGIFTHFASADFDGDEKGRFTKKQFERFMKVADALKERGYRPELCHCCNSAATLLYEDYGLQAVRPGIILYGLTPSAGLQLPCTLTPAMTFKSVVSMVHKVNAGDSVSYGLTKTADKDLTAATIPAGYADGYPRAMSNKGEVLIGGKRCKILGRVCMDQMVVDITEVEGVSQGDEVVLFGRQGEEFIPVEEIASLCGTINYEIVCGISRRVPRYYKREEKVIKAHDYLLGEDA